MTPNTNPDEWMKRLDAEWRADERREKWMAAIVVVYVLGYCVGLTWWAIR